MADSQTDATKKPADPKERIEAAKKRLADEKAQRDKAHAEQRDVMNEVRPTPTQEENDLAAMGEHVIEHEPDGSPPDPGTNQPAPLGTSTRAMESKPGGDYQTRATTPSPSPSPTPAHPKPHG
jgi:hypothetical protein